MIPNDRIESNRNTSAVPDRQIQNISGTIITNGQVKTTTSATLPDGQNKNPPNTTIISAHPVQNTPNTTIIPARRNQNTPNTTIISAGPVQSRPNTKVTPASRNQYRRNITTIPAGKNQNRPNTTVTPAGRNQYRPNITKMPAGRNQNTPNITMIPAGKNQNRPNTTIIADGRSQNARNTSIMADVSVHNAPNTTIIPNGQKLVQNIPSTTIIPDGENGATPSHSLDTHGIIIEDSPTDDAQSNAGAGSEGSDSDDPDLYEATVSARQHSDAQNATSLMSVSSRVSRPRELAPRRGNSHVSRVEKPLRRHIVNEDCISVKPGVLRFKLPHGTSTRAFVSNCDPRSLVKMLVSLILVTFPMPSCMLRAGPSAHTAQHAARSPSKSDSTTVVVT